MKMERIKWAIVIAVPTLVIASVVAAFVWMPSEAQAREWRRETKLQVDYVYFLAGQDDNTEDNLIPIVATLYLTNAQWNNSGNVKIVAYLLRTNPNIAIDKGTLGIGTIRGSKTEEAEVQVVVPGLDTPYEVEFLIFEDDLLVVHGQSSIRVVKYWAGNGYGFAIENPSNEFTPV